MFVFVTCKQLASIESKQCFLNNMLTVFVKTLNDEHHRKKLIESLKAFECINRIQSNTNHIINLDIVECSRLMFGRIRQFMV